MAEQGAVPRTGLVNLHPGGLGAPPGWPLRAACQELADDPGRVRTKARPGTDAEETPLQSRGGAPRGAPASVIGRRSAAIRRSAQPQGGPQGAAIRTAPVGALPPSLFGAR